MESLTQRFDHVYIDQVSRNSEVAQRVHKFFPDNKISIVSGHPLKELKGELSASEFAQSKRLLYLTEFRGAFFKRCPGARPGLACCNYFVLNWGQQCDMNCSYCYLQSFINSPVLTIYTNLDQALDELREMGAGLKEQKLRVGTGEVVDSLSLDILTGYSQRLIRFFKDYPRWNLEFKTKSAQVDQFLDEPHGGNVIASWSVNPQYIVEREEHGTASLSERLLAAEKCRVAGFQIGFHIDPMIWHAEWRENYSKLVDEIVHRFRPEDIPYVSVGGLRFQPEQRHMMRERFGMGSLVTQAEVFTGRDGKLRYDRQLREEMFRFVIQRFKGHSSKWNVFMCMEAPETWLGAYEKPPQKVEGLEEIFDTGVTRRQAKWKANQTVG